MICTLYTFAIASNISIDFLRTLYNLRILYYGLVALVVVPIGAVTLLAFYSYQQADHIGAYTVSSNFLYYAGVSLLPFLTLVLMTRCTWDMRAYELNDQDISFE